MLSTQKYTPPIISTSIHSLEKQQKQLIQMKYKILQNPRMKQQIKCQLLKANEFNLKQVRKCIQKCKLQMVQFWDQQIIMTSQQCIKQGRIIQNQKTKLQSYKLNSSQSIKQNQTESFYSKGQKSTALDSNSVYLHNKYYDLNQQRKTKKENNLRLKHQSEKQQLNDINSQLKDQNGNIHSMIEINQFNLTINDHKNKSQKLLISDILKINHKKQQNHINEGSQSQGLQQKQFQTHRQTSKSACNNYYSNNRQKYTRSHLNKNMHKEVRQLKKKLNKKDIIISSLVQYIQNIKNCARPQQKNKKHQNLNYQNKSSSDENFNSSQQISFLNESNTSQYLFKSYKNNINHTKQDFEELHQLNQLYKKKCQCLEVKLFRFQTETQNTTYKIKQLENKNQQLQQIKLKLIQKNRQLSQKLDKQLTDKLNNNNDESVLSEQIRKVKQLYLKLQQIKRQNQQLKLQRTYLLKRVKICNK